MNTQPAAAVGGKNNTNLLAMTVITAIFFMWGFLTSMNDVLIPHLKSIFALNYTQIMLVQFTFFGAFFLMSLPSGKLVAWFGYKHSIVIGLFVTALGALLFYPAAAVQSYPLFLAAFFILATGITVLQVAANPYISLLGPDRTASSRLNLAQAFNSLGTTLAPKFGGMLILSGTVLTAAELTKLPGARQLAYKTQQAQVVQGPYLGLALILFVLAAVVFLLRLPILKEHAEHDHKAKYSLLEALKHRHMLLGVIGIFVYVGAEVSLGSFMINYISLPNIGDMTEAHAAGLVALYWGGAMVGRFIGSAILQKVDPRKLLGIFASIAALLVVTTMLTTGAIAMWSIVSIGLFNSIMFPNIFTLGIEKMGALTSHASSLLIMAIVGGAIIPLCQGALADTVGVHHAFVLPLACYLYIVFYGFKGSKVMPPADQPAG